MKLTLYKFDTWGNADDGYDVNQWFIVDTVTVSDDFFDGIDYKKLRDIFDISDDVCIEFDGGTYIDLYDGKDGKPLGNIELIN